MISLLFSRDILVCSYPSHCLFSVKPVKVSQELLQHKFLQELKLVALHLNSGARLAINGYSLKE